MARALAAAVVLRRACGCCDRCDRCEDEVVMLSAERRKGLRRRGRSEGEGDGGPAQIHRAAAASSMQQP